MMSSPMTAERASSSPKSQEAAARMKSAPIPSVTASPVATKLATTAITIAAAGAPKG